MNKLKKLLAVLLVVLTVALQPFSAFASTVTTSPFINGNYTHQSQFDGMTISMGLDLSKHNGNVDFNKLKKNGVEFVILRVGYRGYGNAGTLVDDPMFDEYYRLAKKAGIKIGAYFYSQALTVNEAKAEAKKALNKLDGRALDLPLAYDYEFAPASDGRLNTAWRNKTINKSKMTDNALAFCQAVKEAGYKPMVYASKYFFYDNLNRATLNKNNIPIWLAHYTRSTDYDSEFQIWQYTSSGKVDGISGNVDCNFMYLNSNNDLITLKGKPEVGISYRGVRTLVAKWNEMDDVDGYEVMIYKNGGWSSAGYTNENKFKFENLSPAANYGIKVRAYKKQDGVKGFSKFSVSVKVGTKPAKVKGLKSVETTDDSIKFSWTKEGYPTSYNVYKYNSKTKKYELYKNVKTNSIKVTGLKQKYRYSFKVQAVRETNDGKTFLSEKSEKKVFTTRPKAPTVKSVTSPKKQRINITWNKNRDRAGYVVQWSTTKNFTSNYKQVTVKGGTNYKTTIKTAQSNRNYYVRVKSYIRINGKVYYSPWSSTQKIKVK